MIFYLTYNDAPSGIFSSQVIDVVKFLRSELNVKIKLISFISIRHFFENRKKIKSELDNAIVLPMFPGVARWKWNVFQLLILSFIFRPKKIIGRSTLATHLAIKIKSFQLTEKVIYDGRGAIEAEWKEYKVIAIPKMLAEIFELEKQVVLNSDYRIAVSNQLVKHWQETFNYTSHDHVVIPCTINKVFEDVMINEETVSRSRERLKLSKEDVVFMYSGSVAGWQSFDLLYQFLNPVLSANKKNKMLFLSGADKNIEKLKQEFPSQILCTKVKPNEVPDYLLAGDYGLLIREKSVTNKVASPVKFAEYLACGLNVIVSENLGDYSEFVLQHNCGGLFQINQISPLKMEKTKQEKRKLALAYFRKGVFVKQYQTVCKI